MCSVGAKRVDFWMPDIVKNSQYCECGNQNKVKNESVVTARLDHKARPRVVFSVYSIYVHARLSAQTHRIRYNLIKTIYRPSRASEFTLSFFCEKRNEN